MGAGAKPPIAPHFNHCLSPVSQCICLPKTTSKWNAFNFFDNLSYNRCVVLEISKVSIVMDDCPVGGSGKIT